MDSEKQRTLGAVLLLVAVLAVPMVAIYLTRYISGDARRASYYGLDPVTAVRLARYQYYADAAVTQQVETNRWQNLVEDLSERTEFLSRFAQFESDPEVVAYVRGLAGNTGPSIGFNTARAGDAICGQQLNDASHFLGKAAGIMRDYTDTDGLVDVREMSDNDFVRFDVFSRTGVATLSQYLICMDAR